MKILQYYGILYRTILFDIEKFESKLRFALLASLRSAIYGKLGGNFLDDLSAWVNLVLFGEIMKIFKKNFFQLCILYGLG